MADDDIGRTGVLQHFRGNIAGMGTKGFRGTILPPNGDRGAGAKPHRLRNQRRRRTDENLPPTVLPVATASQIAATCARSARNPFIFQFPATSGVNLFAIPLRPAFQPDLAPVTPAAKSGDLAGA